MNELPFDNFVKRKFGNYTPDVPPHIAENIFAARKTKPKGFWFNWLSKGNIFVSLLLITGAGGYYFISQPHSEKIRNKNLVHETSNSSSSAKNGDINIQDKKEQSLKSDEQTNIDKPNNQSANFITPVTPANASSASTSNVRYSIINENAETQNGKIPVNRYTINKETNSDYSDLKKLLFPYTFNNARELKDTRVINNKNVKLPDCPSIEKNAAGNKKYWEVYAGPDYAINNYRTYSDTASNNYLQKTKASTKFASAFSAGVRYTKVFNNAVSIRTGLNYSQVNEKFIYFNPSELKYVTVITTRVIIRSPGDTLYINDTLQYQQSGTRTKATQNRYRSIDVPLVIGYELGNGKVHANINAGIIINVYSWYKGDALDTSYQPVSITTGKGNPQYQFKNNIGVGFLGSASFYYRFTDQMHLVIEPYFRYNLSPMSNNNSNLQQKFHTAGIRAGIRWDIK